MRRVSSLAGSARLHRLIEYRLRGGRIFLKIFAELARYERVDKGPYLGISELALRLTLKLRLGQLDRNYRAYSLAHVLARELCVGVLERARLACVLVYRLGQRRLEARLVRTAVGRYDVICKGEQRLVIACVVLERYLGGSQTLFIVYVDNVRMNGVGMLMLSEIFNERFYTALIAEHILADGILLGVDILIGDERKRAKRLALAEVDALYLSHRLRLVYTRAAAARIALVAHYDGNARIKERLLAHAVEQNLVVVVDVVEYLRIGHEADIQSVTVARVAEAFKCILDLSSAEALAVQLSVGYVLVIQPLGERIYDRRAYAV